MSRNILCVVEFDNYPETVVARATWLAGTHGYDLHLLVSDPVTDLLGESYVYLLESQHIAKSIRELREQAVARLLDPLEASGIGVTVERSADKQVADVIRRAAAACEPAYVVKGTHLHTPSERASLGHADWELIRDLDYPLWFVKPVDWQDDIVVVAAVDPVHAHDKPAHLDKRIIELGRAIATDCGGRLEVLHTYQRLAEIGSCVMWTFKPQTLPVADLDRKIRERHGRALKILGEVCELPPESLHLVPGRPDEVLPVFARRQSASLVVMGALARSKLGQGIVGSTTTRVLDHIPCDVLVAHPHQRP
ncbi:MAG: universal stress protein [Proteobacteria bacterium]|nr:universal stress protein [Pseudomonadota bacterium]